MQLLPVIRSAVKSLRNDWTRDLDSQTAWAFGGRPPLVPLRNHSVAATDPVVSLEQLHNEYAERVNLDLAAEQDRQFQEVTEGFEGEAYEPAEGGRVPLSA